MLLVSESAGTKAVLFDAHTYVFGRKEKRKKRGKKGESGRKTVNESGRRGEGTASQGLGWVPVKAHLPAGCLGQSFCEVVKTGGGPVSCDRVQHLKGRSVSGEADWEERKLGQLQGPIWPISLRMCQRPAQLSPPWEHHRTPTLSTSREAPLFGFVWLTRVDGS